MLAGDAGRTRVVKREILATAAAEAEAKQAGPDSPVSMFFTPTGVQLDREQDKIDELISFLLPDNMLNSSIAGSDMDEMIAGRVLNDSSFLSTSSVVVNKLMTMLVKKPEDQARYTAMLFEAMTRDVVKMLASDSDIVPTFNSIAQEHLHQNMTENLARITMWSGGSGCSTCGS